MLMNLTAAENLRVSRCDVGRAVELFPELEPHLGRRVGLLSGGQQQMLALARGLARSPRLLLVDELSLGLAPLVVERLLGVVRAAADEGVGVLLVEQHVHKAMDVADRVLVMRRGAIALAGRADELRDRTDDIRDAYLSTTDTGGTNSDDATPDTTARQSLRSNALGAARRLVQRQQQDHSGGPRPAAVTSTAVEPRNGGELSGSAAKFDVVRIVDRWSDRNGQRGTGEDRNRRGPRRDQRKVHPGSAAGGDDLRRQVRRQRKPRLRTQGGEGRHARASSRRSGRSTTAPRHPVCPGSSCWARERSTSPTRRPTRR